MKDKKKIRSGKTNWSQAEDRSEDLINERDPFVQQPERDTNIGNLADRFDAERQTRQEKTQKKGERI